MCHALRSQRWGLLAIVIALGAFLYPLPMAAIMANYAKYGKWTASLPALYFWTSVTPFASLALFGLFIREVRECNVEWDA